MSIIKSVVAASFLIFSIAGIALAADPLPAIKVSDNGRYFVKADGTPFFWLGDTAWGIFNHPTPEEVDQYLDDRAAKGFNVIQGVIALWDYRNRKNPDGELPFTGNDFGQINEAFYKNVDSILDKVQAHHMYMAILPFWNKNFPVPLRDAENQKKLVAYHAFLAQRYAKRNIFWVLGGDASGALQGIEPYTDLMAQGLIDGAKSAGVEHILISYHPTGRQSSSFWFQERPWMNFNSIQSGHFINTTNFRLVGADFAKQPVKPTLDMEPGYENITDNLVRNDPTAKRIGAEDVRRSAYLAVFAGAAGHTYGNGEVYEFWSPEKGVTPPVWSSKVPFKESLKLPGSGQMQFVRYLIESRPMLLRMPDQSLIAGDVAARATERSTAMLASDGSYAFVYTQGKPITVHTDKLSGATLVAWWYDPRTGKATRLDQFAKTESKEFTPPPAAADQGNNDWVLVLDDASKNYSTPGKQP